MNRCMTYPQWICYLNEKVNRIEEQIVFQTSSVLFGDIEPESNIGNNGDVYFQFNGACVYLKENELWIFQGKLLMSEIDGGDF